MKHGWICAMGVTSSLLVACEGFSPSGREDGDSGEGGDGGATAAATTSEGTTVAGETTSAEATSSASTGVAATPSKVWVLDRVGAGIEGVLAFSNDADGILVDEGTSDAEGRVSLEMPAGGSLHVAREATFQVEGASTTTQSIVSQLDLDEGVTVTFRVRRGDEIPEPIPNAPMKLSLFNGTYPDVYGTVDTLFGVSCGGTFRTPTAAWVIDAFRGCPGEDTFSVYMVGYDATGAIVYALREDDIPFVAGTQKTLQLALEHVSFPLSRITLQAAPGSDGSLSVSLGGSDHGLSFLHTSTDPSTDSLSTQARVPRLFDSYGYTAMALDAGHEAGFVRHFASAASLPDTLTVDTATLAPVAVDAVDWGNPEHPVVTASLGVGPEGDLVAAFLAWGDTRHVSWTGYADVASTVVMRLPDVPAAIDDWLVTQNEPRDRLEVSHQKVDLNAGRIDASAVDLTEKNRTFTFAIAP